MPINMEQYDSVHKMANEIYVYASDARVLPTYCCATLVFKEEMEGLEELDKSMEILVRLLCAVLVGTRKLCKFSSKSLKSSLTYLTYLGLQQFFQKMSLTVHYRH